MSRGWGARSGAGRSHAGRTHGVRHQHPAEAWRELIATARDIAAGRLAGPGAWEQLAARRTACAGAPLPAEGEPAKSAGHALLELVRTWARCGEDGTGWRADGVIALARECEVLIERQAAARMGRMMGEKD